MLHKCANPACCAQFRYLHQGWLFEVEVQQCAGTSAGVQDRSWNGKGRVERWWLCERCAAHIALQFDPQQGLIMVSSLEDSEGVVIGVVRQADTTGAPGIARILVRPLDLDATVLTRQNRASRLRARTRGIA